MTDELKLFAEGQPVLEGIVSPVFQKSAAELGRRLPVRFVNRPDWGDAPERFDVHLGGDGARIAAASEAGWFYGLQTLKCRIREEGWQTMDFQEEPVVPERGLKLYLPPPDEAGLEEFRRIIDFAAECRCNFVMLELGGALEYHSHPEINEGWTEYADCMNEFPGKTLKVQNSFSWRKNSIHTENGGGRFLTQEKFMDLVGYCRERYLEVIPEMPSLSHSDYLLTRHRELAERPEDPFPDTCCPLNEGYHRLYQDLLEEVIDLMHPRRLNIGHDEFYTMGLCPRCRCRNFPELYAADINRIAGWLRSRGVEPVMFGEKLLDSHWLNGEPIGGAAVPETPEMEALPAIWPSADLITEPVEIFHWYWTVDRKLDRVYGEHGMPYCFANLSPAQFRDWNARMRAPFARGICVSNWGQTSMRTLQRNGVLFDLAYAAELLWNPQADPEDYPAVSRKIFRRLYLGNDQFRGCEGPVLTVCHTVQTDWQFQYFFDGFLLDEGDFRLGEHVFREKGTGRVLRFPVIFGSNISNGTVRPDRWIAGDSFRDAYDMDLQYPEVSWETLPEQDEQGVMWYRCRYELPPDCGELQYEGFEACREYQVRLKNFQQKKASGADC